MHSSQNLFLSVLIIGLLLVGGFLLLKKPQSADIEYPTPVSVDAETVLYTDQTYGISFSYPKSWGEPTVRSGNSACPEEDTYRTADQVVIYDREIRFTQHDLPGTDSYIESGIRLHRLDPTKASPCNNELIKSLATKKITGQEISSVKLDIANIPGFYGVHNENASRLDTEGREQYTLFVEESPTSILVVQPYMSFIPYAESPEWKEISTKYPNNMSAYLKEGNTADAIRSYIVQFRKLAEGVKYTK